MLVTPAGRTGGLMRKTVDFSARAGMPVAGALRRRRPLALPPIFARDHEAGMKGRAQGAAAHGHVSQVQAEKTAARITSQAKMSLSVRKKSALK